MQYRNDYWSFTYEPDTTGICVGKRFETKYICTTSLASAGLVVRTCSHWLPGFRTWDTLAILMLSKVYSDKIIRLGGVARINVALIDCDGMSCFSYIHWCAALVNNRKIIMNTTSTHCFSSSNFVIWAAYLPCKNLVF